MPPGNREQRGSLRVRWSAPLHYRPAEPGATPGPLRDGRVLDLSSSGALIAVDDYFRIGATIALQVTSNDPPLRLATLAVGVRHVETADPAGKQYGFGVEFRGLPRRERADLAAFLLLQASRLGQRRHHTAL